MNRLGLTAARLASLQSVVALGLLALALALSTDSFWTADNGVNVLRQIAVNLCLSIGMTLVVVGGGIDLSVGSVLALSGVVAAGFSKYGVDLPVLGVHVEANAWGGVLTGITVGALCGAFNGQAITRFGLPPFVATLGMLSIARGLTMLATGGHPITGLGDDWRQLGSGQIAGVPTPAWVVAGVAAVFVVVTRHTIFGRHLYAVGGSERAAALSGIDVGGVKRLAYTLCGALAGLAGVLVAARLDSATPNAGVAYELDSIAAVVIGGASLSGGRGTILGAVLGCLLIGVLNNGLVLLEVSPFWQQVIKGGVILAAVAVDRATRPEN